jgi:acyl-CoA synthetase (AMP-forming)/AMP-acid ligase II
MSAAEAKTSGVGDKRGFYFRADGAGVAKQNLAPPSTKATWYRLESVDLGNGTEEHPLGDQVGVVTSWKWPDAFDGVTVDDIPKVQSVVASGSWREDVRSKKWVGYAVARALGLDASNEDLGEEAKAVVQLMPGVAPGGDVEAELIGFCRRHLAHIKCPRSIDFETEFFRLPTGKLYKTALRDRYWTGHASRIL